MLATLTAPRDSSNSLAARRADIHKRAAHEAKLIAEESRKDVFEEEYNRFWCEGIMSQYTGKPSETVCTSGPYYTEEEILRINREKRFFKPLMIRRDCLVGPHHIKIGQDGFAFMNYNLAKSVGTYGVIEAFCLRYEAEWTGPYLDDLRVFDKHAVTLFLEGSAMPGYFKYMGTFYLRKFSRVNLDLVSNPRTSTYINDAFEARVKGVTTEERNKCSLGVPLLIVQAAKDFYGNENPFKTEPVASG
ncbi:hypothetical protein H1R20_g10022, partial [Candolleomyces eurysporus]